MVRSMKYRVPIIPFELGNGTTFCPTVCIYQDFFVASMPLVYVSVPQRD